MSISNKVKEYPSVRKAAVALGIPESTLRGQLKKENNMLDEYIGDGMMTLGTSVAYDRTGTPVMTWIKTKVDDDKLAQAIDAAVKALSEKMPVYPKIKPPEKTNEDLLNLYVLTDYHLGMLADGDETRDEDWNISKASKLLIAWFTEAIKKSPKSDHAVLAQLGDLLHIDGGRELASVTAINGFNLDSDTRFQKLVRSAIFLMRTVINMLLKKHNKVTVIMAEGNHDISSRVWLVELLNSVYANNDRVTVELSPDPYYAVKHGKTSLFFHHGHKCNINKVDSVFASKFRNVFGNTKHAYGHIGHLHHIAAKETALMVIEQHRTLAPKDAYASRGGYLSGRSASVITYDKNYGEVSRITLTPEAVL